MKKRLLAALGAGAVAYVMSDENRKQKVMKKVEGLKNKYFGEKDQIPEVESGKPDFQNVENSKMVDEGSQFGVQYYNKVQEGEDPTKLPTQQ
ncbi:MULTISPECIES: hypothetical protein [Allobacillus]|uniref:YtxH domain-containing protein n=1 Tax=Allobacillus salarius TaxID=1955272 RepID=A0A556PLV9_9BACI|nr:hypothetical protein [Allobacillus salarius]TSJ65375.1 hypothetical protein FPQ13_07355 [Allobacillus salarius]